MIAALTLSALLASIIPQTPARGVVVDSGTPDPTLLFEWHMEDLDVTVGTPAGYSAGDTVGAVSSLAAISNTQAQDGSNSLSIPTSGDKVTFTVSTEDILDGSEGRVEFYVYVTSIANTTALWAGTDGAGNFIRIRMTTDALEMDYVNSGAPDLNTTTTGGSLTTGSWLKVIAQWRQSGDPNIRITIDDANAGIDNDDPGAAVAPVAMEFGAGTGGGVYFLDNAKIYNAYE